MRPAIGEFPKVMATVQDRPFLDIILEDLIRQGARRIVLLAGYKADIIKEYYRKQSLKIDIEFSVELMPLGTGGAVKNAKGLLKTNPFLIMNGDSFCPVDFKAYLKFYQDKKAWGSLVLSQAETKKDFGSVVIDGGNRVRNFLEKVSNDAEAAFGPSSLYLNAGIYCFSQEIFKLLPAGEKFSLEIDVFPKILDKEIFGFVVDQSFTDIGTPERYNRAKENLKKG